MPQAPRGWEGVVMDDYEKYVGCAMSFYRNRWVHVPKFKKSGRRAVMVSRHRDNCRMARAYIQKARLAKNGILHNCVICGKAFPTAGRCVAHETKTHR